MNNRWFALLAAALLAAAGSFAVLAFSVRDPDSPFLDKSRGAGPLVEDARAAGLQVERLLSTPLVALGPGNEDPARTLLVVLDPPQPYSEEEAQGVRDFVLSGGKVLVADSFGQGNSLVQTLGIFFTRVRLVEPAEGGTALLDRAEFRLQWSNPSSLQLLPESDAVVLANSTGRSYLDRDGNGTIDASDPSGPFPLVVQVTLGKGTLLAVADSGPFRVDGSQAADNAAWRRTLLDHLLPEGGLVLLDESRSGSANPLLSSLAALAAVSVIAPWKWVIVAVAASLGLLPLLPSLASAWGAHKHRPNRFVRRRDINMAAVGQESPRSQSYWTPRGVVALTACGALLLLGFVARRPEAVAAGSVLLVALATALLHDRPRLHARRVLSMDQPEEGARVDVQVLLQKEGRRALHLEMRDALPETFDLVAGSNWFAAQVRSDGIEAGYAFKPALRGPHAVGPLLARTLDPLGLRAKEATIVPSHQVQVAPWQEQVRKIPFTTKVPTVTLGPHLVNRAGEGSEFHALRGYVQGDSLRSVNWKASARARTLVVNQRVHESMTRLAIFLDARAVSAAGTATTTPLAVGCRVVLGMAAGALRVRDRIHVVLYGDGVREVPYAPGSRQIHELRDVLSSLQPAGETGLLEAVRKSAPTLQARTPVLIVSGLEGDASFVEGVQELRGRGLLPLVVTSPIGVRPQEPGEDGEEPDAERLEAGRQRTLEELRALGVSVHETVPGLPLDHLFRLGGAA